MHVSIVVVFYSCVEGYTFQEAYTFGMNHLLFSSCINIKKCYSLAFEKDFVSDTNKRVLFDEDQKYIVLDVSYCLVWFGFIHYSAFSAAKAV